MDTLHDLVASLGEGEALRTGAGGRSGREVRDRAYRAGNFLRHCGVREGAAVGVADDPAPAAAYAFLGTALLGGVTRFDPPADFDGRAYVAPADGLDAVSLPPGGQYVGYGAPPDDPAHAHFERDAWSENPAFPEPDFAGDVPALDVGEETYAHADLLAAAADVAERFDADDVVAVRASLRRPGTVVAGLLAPLAAGATVRLPAGADAADATVAVAVGGDAPEPAVVAPDAVAV